MIKKEKHISQFQIAMRAFRQNRQAMVCLYLLIILYAGAIFADFLSPYKYDNEDRNYSYGPPTVVRIFDGRQLSFPFVYGSTLTFDNYHKRVYIVDRTQKYPLNFLVKGDEYKLFGLIPTTLRLFGVDAPARIYLFGADSRGRDLYSRLLYGGRISLTIGLVGVAISFSIGLLLGGIAGFYGGKVDDIIMRLCEMVMMVPGFYLLLALRAAVPDHFNSVQVYFAIVVIMSFIGWAGLARIIRGMCLSLKTREYVLAARVMGLSDLNIIVKHILPHTLSYSIIAIMLAVPGYILGESALSLIGLGIVDPIPSWGNMLTDAMSVVHVNFAPWILLPGLFILITVMCFNVIGDVLRDCLDPKFKMERTV